MQSTEHPDLEPEALFGECRAPSLSSLRVRRSCLLICRTKVQTTTEVTGMNRGAPEIRKEAQKHVVSLGASGVVWVRFGETSVAQAPCGCTSGKFRRQLTG